MMPVGMPDYDSNVGTYGDRRLGLLYLKVMYNM